MPRKRPIQPNTDFHMKTRSRKPNVTPEPEIPDTEESSLSSLDSPPTTPPSIPSSRKRKSAPSSSDDVENMPAPKRFALKISAPKPPPVSPKPPKRKGRPSLNRPKDVSTVSKEDSSSPATQQSITPPDSADSSRRNSRVLRSETLEASSDPISQPQIQIVPTAVVATTEVAAPHRRSLRNATKEVTAVAAATSAPAIQPPSLPTAPAPPVSGKRKSASASPDDPEAAPKKRKRTPGTAKEKSTQQASDSWNKDKELWPEFDKSNVIYYAVDGATQFRPGDNEGTPESRSPRKPARGGGRGGRGGNRGGRKGKGKGNGGRGGSPDPPDRREPLSREEKAMISILKARQQDLKRFFNAVGSQQIDMLDQMASRDITKIAKKPNAHRKVSEFDDIVEQLQAAMEDAQDLARKRLAIEVEAEERRLEAEQWVVEQQFKTRNEESREEHLAGAEGDILLFERAYRAAHDDMHTESGSSMMDQLPRYHELPEPDNRPRGYTSTKILDEKPFKRQLEGDYDEKARQEVLNEDVIGPLFEDIRQHEQEERLKQRRQKSQTMHALSEEATKQLEQIEGYLVPRPMDMAEANSYALSALADVSEWVAQQHPQKQYIYVPLAKGDQLPAQALDFAPLPGHFPPPPLQQTHEQIMRAPGNRGRKLKYPPLSYEQAKTTSIAASGYPSLQPQAPPPPHASPYPVGPDPMQSGPPPPQRIVSSGPGQVIAPAPPRVAASAPRPNVNIFRHNTRYPPPPPPPPPQTPNHTSHTRHNSFTVSSPNGPVPSPQQPQQYIFQTPQQPFQHQGGPPAPSTPQLGPVLDGTAPPSVAASPGPLSSAPSPGPVGGPQNKMTFVNQTVESRAAAAQVTQDGNGNGVSNGPNMRANGTGSGKRTLLPKGY